MSSSIFQWITSDTLHHNAGLSLVQSTDTGLSLAEDLQMTEDKKFKNLELVFSHEFKKASPTFLNKTINVFSIAVFVMGPWTK